MYGSGKGSLRCSSPLDCRQRLLPSTHLDVGVEQGGQARGQHVAVAAARAPTRLNAAGRNVGAQRLEARRQCVLRGSGKG